MDFFQNDVEMPIPKYFINERAKALKEREKVLGQILAKLGPQDKDAVSYFDLHICQHFCINILAQPLCIKTIELLHVE